MGQQHYGDTTLTKVFVGGLAWETQKDALREHFDKYGDILEAVIISDKLSGRSKGYGFVTFKEAEAAKKACENAAPVINGRRANCNLASLGAKFRPSPPATPTPPHQHVAGMAIGSRGALNGSPTQWYYHPSGTPAPPSLRVQHPHYSGILPYYAVPAAYGYSPNYMTVMNYNSQKLGHNAGGGYYQGQFSYPAPGVVAANSVVPMYPLYQFPHPPSQGMVVPQHFFAPTCATTGSMATNIPAIISKPAVITPHSAVKQVKGCS